MVASLGITGNDGHQMGVTPDNQACVTVAPYPSLEMQKTKPFRQYLTLDGTPDGDSNLGQDGSVNQLEFVVRANESNDIYLTHLSFAVGYGTSGKPFEFADGAALINGAVICYTSSRGEIELHSGIKRNEDLMRLSKGQFATDWEIRGIGAANDYGYFVDIHLLDFAPMFGIKLDSGTNQVMAIRIRDDMASVSAAGDKFNCIARGFERFS